MQDTTARRSVKKLSDRIDALERRVDSHRYAAPQLMRGTVLRTGVGTYDLLVDAGGRQIQCLALSKLAGSPFGTSDTDMPLEGSSVVLVTGVDGSDIGYVLGAAEAPATDIGESEADQGAPSPDGGPWPQLSLSDTLGPSTYSEDIYDQARRRSSENDGLGGIDAGRHKPADVFPGEFVRVNEFGVGIDCDTLTARVRGGPACIGASFVDGAVELVSRNFRSADVSGSTRVFSDGGLVTRETVVSPYLGERKGGFGVKARRLTDDEREPSVAGGTPRQAVGKFRLQTYEGYLGGIYSTFLSRQEKPAEKTDELRTTSDLKPKDVGLMQLHINDNGRLMYRSAGGIMIGRSDIIPVPVRIREFSDPDGMKVDDVEHDDVLMFETPKDTDGNRSPHYNILAIADREAYEYRRSYDRFLEFVADDEEAEKGSDFYIQEEEDLPLPGNKAGTPDMVIEPDDLESNAGRRSSIIMPPDGSIILRDGWGSEVIFSGGNITFNTPGSIMLAPGRSFVCLAGDDAVVKAAGSIDVVSTGHDVTVNGACALKLVGGSDTTGLSGGVLIESFSKDTDVNVDEKGEKSRFTGITLKSTDSHVSILGRTAVLGATDEVRVVTGAGQDTREGRVVVATGQLGLSSEEGMTLSASGAGITAAGGSLSIAGDSVAVASRDGTMFATPSQVGVPLMFDTRHDMASVYLNGLKNYKDTEARDDRVKPYRPSKYFSKTLFTFRTSEDCGTTSGWELTDPPDNFTLYQPFWTVLADLGVDTLSKVRTREWPSYTVAGDHPWPGTDAVNDGHYARLEKIDPVNLQVRTVEVDDGKGGKDKKRVLCSKKFDSITGEKDSDAVKVKLDSLDMYKIRRLDTVS